MWAWFSSGGILVFLSGGWDCFAAVRAHGGAAKQLAVVLRQSSRVRSGCHDVPHRRSCQTPDSWFPGCGYSAYETCALPWRPAGKAYTGSAKYVERQKRDQSACRSFSFSRDNLGYDPIVRPLWVMVDNG